MNKTLTRVVLILFVCALCGVAGLRQYYARYRPQKPDPAQYLIVPVEVNYNVVVYVTPAEKVYLELTYNSIWIPVGVIAVYFLLLVFKAAKSDTNL